MTNSNIIMYTSEDGLTRIEKSLRGTQFRMWATGILKEYMQKGFAFSMFCGMLKVV